MAEKRGNTEKLLFPFNTAGVLEIYYPNTDRWYRTTATTFRSFDGPRRITEPTAVEKGNPHVPMRTYDCSGPLYHLRTNRIVKQRRNDHTIRDAE